MSPQRHESKSRVAKKTAKVRAASPKSHATDVTLSENVTPEIYMYMATYISFAYLSGA